MACSSVWIRRGLHHCRYESVLSCLVFTCLSLICLTRTGYRQEEARQKVRQAVAISFGPEDPKGQEMLTMLQFVQTLQDLEMFTEKYQDDLNDLAKIQVEMQLKTLSTWKRKTKGLMGALRAGMLLRGNAWNTDGPADSSGQLSEEERLALEKERREAEERERQWAEKEQAMKDAMMRQEEARLAAERLRAEEERAAERLRAEEERLRAEEEAERKRLLELKRLARIRARQAAIRRIQGTTDENGSSAAPKFPYSGIKARPTRLTGRKARAFEHGGPRYHTVDLEFSDEEMEDEAPHGALPTHYYHGKPVAGAVGAAVEESRRKNMVASRQPGQHWQPRQHGEAQRAVPAMLNRRVASIQDAATTAAAAMDRARCGQVATTYKKLVVNQVAIDLEEARAAGDNSYRTRVKDHLKRSVYKEHYPSVVAETLASAIRSGADKNDHFVGSTAEAEAVTTSQQWQESTEVTSGARSMRMCRRSASARPRLQHGCTNPNAEEYATSSIRSGALLVPAPPSLQQQLQRGKSAGSTRVHASTGTNASSRLQPAPMLHRAGSAPAFRGRAVVHPRTDAGYFHPTPPEVIAAPAAGGWRDCTEDHTNAGLVDGTGASAVEGVHIKTSLPPPTHTPQHQMSRLLPLFNSSVLVVASAAPHASARTDELLQLKKRSLEAASAACARFEKQTVRVEQTE